MPQERLKLSDYLATLQQARRSTLPKLTFKLKGLQALFQKLTPGLRPQRHGTCWQAKQTLFHLLCKIPTTILTTHADNLSDCIDLSSRGNCFDSGFLPFLSVLGTTWECLFVEQG